ncbi:MAG: hypothetical protein QM705_03780 [Ancrocorticia sp.]
MVGRLGGWDDGEARLAGCAAGWLGGEFGTDACGWSETCGKNLRDRGNCVLLGVAGWREGEDMKRGLLALVFGLVLGLVVALVVPLGEGDAPTSGPSGESTNSGDDGAAHSRTGGATARTTAESSGTDGSVAGTDGSVAGTDGSVAGTDVKTANGEALPDHEQMLAIVRDLVRRRDMALLYKSKTELNALSVPGSPVRGADEELLRELEDASIISLRTEVQGVKVLGPDELDELDVKDLQNVGDHNARVAVEVTTIQEELEVEGQAAVGPLEERCARWLLTPNPWRLDEVLECEA